MAKKRVEEQGENVQIVGLDEEIPKTEIPKRVQETSAVASYSPKKNQEDDGELINCLRNEKVIVRFLKKPSLLVSDPKHVLYGGMSETATKRFVVPRLSSTGLYVNVLTNSEMRYLEEVMGLERGTLSIYKKQNNFWDDTNPQGIGKVILHKQDNFLDLSVPEDYIKYKILLANKNYIAKSIRDLEDHPKATYQFVIVSENAEAQHNLSRMDATMKCYMEYGKIESDIDTLRTVIELTEGRPLSPKVKLDYLQGKINEHIQKNPRQFLSVLKDEYLPAKVLIKKCVEYGLIGTKNNNYYLRSDGTPLCEIDEESTLNNAARFISSLKHQDLKFLLEARVKENQ